MKTKTKKNEIFVKLFLFSFIKANVTGSQFSISINQKNL